MGPVSEGDLGGVYTVPYSEVGSVDYCILNHGHGAVDNCIETTKPISIQRSLVDAQVYDGHTRIRGGTFTVF